MSIKLSFSCLVDAPYEDVAAYLSKKESLKRMIPPWAPSNWRVTSKRVDSTSETFYLGFVTPLISCKIKRSLVSLESRQTQVIDEVDCQARMGLLFFEKTLKTKLRELINHQHANIIEDLKQLRLSQVSSNDVIVIAGASGFIGRFIKTMLGLFGYKVKILVRHRPNVEEEIFWDPQCELIDKRALEGAYGVINLSGESIFSFRWTKKKKERIMKSRIQATRFLAETMNSLKYPPKVFFSASAVGFYGDRINVQLTEHSAKGEGFLSDVASLWEETSLQYTKGRVCSLRLGVVMGAQGGVLKKLKPLFSLGLGAILGSGKEVMSWISIDDVAYQILFLLKHQVKGAVNLCSSQPITQQEFAQILGKHCKKRVLLKIPRWLVRLLFGQMSSLFLFSTAAQPKKLLELGAVFSYPNFKNTLHHQIQP